MEGGYRGSKTKVSRVRRYRISVPEGDDGGNQIK